eukprot:4420767-Prymnesium_polylepis.2
MEPASEPPTLCLGQPVLTECWCQKRSRVLGVWRARWLVLTPAALHTFVGWRGYETDEPPTESFAVPTLTVRPRTTGPSGALGAALQLDVGSRLSVLLFFSAPPSGHVPPMVAASAARRMRDLIATSVVDARLYARTRLPCYAPPPDAIRASPHARGLPTPDRHVHCFEPAGLVRCEERYELGRELGRGAFGTVHQATCLQSGARVAVKAVGKRCDDVAREVSLMRQVRVRQA